MPTKVRMIDGKEAEVPDILGTKGEVYGATITVGAEDGSSVINVAIQLTDFLGGDLATRASIFAWLTDDAAGQTVGTAHSSSPAIGTDGFMQVLITDLTWILTCETDGDIDIDFTDSGSQTIYLNLLMPNGTTVTSDAITHAA